MALTRARVLLGPLSARLALQQQITKVLTAPRDPAKLRTDVLHMRSEMLLHKPAKGPLDVKLARGGLVDAEFVVHFLQLRHGKGLEPALAQAIDALAKAGLVSPDLAKAHDVLTRCLIASRLLAPDANVPPPAAQLVLASACQCGDWEELLAQLSTARAAVAAAWLTTFGEHLEID